jgi:hypothetical protein
MRTLLPTSIALILCASIGTAESTTKLRRPRLDLRATPRVAFSPVLVTVFAELQGGDEVEDYYCPELEWDWNDGAKSRHEQDCPPFETGAKLERRFTGEHAYSGPGNYTVKLTLKRAGRVVATANTMVLVNAGVGQGALQ